MESDPEPECGLATSRRSRSVAPSGSRLTLSAAPASLSVSSSHLSVSTSNLSGGGRRARAAPSLCESHRPPRVCLQRPCPALHVCRLFVEGFCPRGSNCRWGHSVLSADNTDILEEFELASLSERDLLWMIRSLVRNTAPVSVEEYHRELTLCPEYAAEAYCQHDDCFRLHLCPRWVKGKCSATGCRWSHRLDNPDNVMVLLRLRCADMSEMEILTQLALNMEHDREDGQTTGDDAGDEGSSDSVDTQYRKNAAAAVATRSESLENTVKERIHGHSASENVLSGASLGCNFVPQTVSGRRASSDSDSRKAGREKTVQAPEPHLTMEEMKRNALSLDICPFYCFPSKCDEKISCGKLHLCRFFLPGICTFSIAWCMKSHKLNTPHNRQVLRQHKLLDLPEKELVKALKAGYLGRYPVTDTERRYLVQMCHPYQDKKCRQKSICTRIHICRGYVQGTCEASRECGQSHDLNSPHNAKIVRKLGFPNGLMARDIMEILRNPVSVTAMRKSWDHKKPKVLTATSSGSTTLPVQVRPPNQQMLPEQDQKNQRSSPLKVMTTKEAGKSCLLDVVAALASDKGSGSTCCASSDVQRCADEPLILEKSDPRQSYPPGAITVLEYGSGGSSDNQSVDVVNAVTLESKEAVPMVSSETHGDSSHNNGPVLCAVHASGAICSRDNCDGFHVCGYFLANLCQRPNDSCPLNHSFQSEHNMRVMQLHGLVSGSPEDFQIMLDKMTRQMRITFENGAHQKVKICTQYNSLEGCGKTGICGGFHVCRRFLSGTCFEPGCSLRHNLFGGHNQCVRKSLGLGSSSPVPGHIGPWASDWDLIELLRARMGLKPGAYLVPEQEQPATETSRAATELKLVAELTEPAAPLAKPFAEIAKPSAGSPAKKKATLPAICRRHCMGLRCSDANCAALHICPHYVASYCKRQNCALGHELKTKHNQEALRRCGYTQIPANQAQMIKALYADSPHIRRTEVYNKLRICISHNRSDGCGNSKCLNIHVCQRFVAGSCHERGCSLGHNVDTASNRRKLQQMKLADASVNEVLELLRAIHGFRSGFAS